MYLEVRGEGELSHDFPTSQMFQIYPTPPSPWPLPNGSVQAIENQRLPLPASSPYGVQPQKKRPSMAMIGLTILGSLVVIYMLSKLSNKNLTELHPKQADDLEYCTRRANDFMDQDIDSHGQQHGNGQSQSRPSPKQADDLEYCTRRANDFMDQDIDSHGQQHGNGQSQSRPSQNMYQFQDEKSGGTFWVPANDKSVSIKDLAQGFITAKQNRHAREKRGMKQNVDIRAAYSALRIEQNRHVDERHQMEQDLHHVENIAQIEADTAIKKSNCKTAKKVHAAKTQVQMEHEKYTDKRVVDTRKEVTKIAESVGASSTCESNCICVDCTVYFKPLTSI